MKDKQKRLLALLVAASCLIYGCTPNTDGLDESQSTQIESQEDGENSSENQMDNKDDTTKDNNEIGSDTQQGSQMNLSESKVVIDKEFTARDLEVGFEESTATKMTLKGTEIIVSGNGATAKDSVVTITGEGSYVVTGSLTDGQIIVDVADNEKVQIVLDGVTIHCDDHAPIYIKNADKVFLTLKENSVNTLTDGKEYVQVDDNIVDGVIFSKADLTLNGEGSLKIVANYKHGILSKDDIVITGGIYDITALKDTINGKDAVKIKDGSFTLSASTGNGIQSKHDEDETKGYVYIVGGDITVIDCEEGIEGTVILIEGGNLDITAKDDGLNSSSGITTTTTGTQTTEIERQTAEIERETIEIERKTAEIERETIEIERQIAKSNNIKKTAELQTSADTTQSDETKEQENIVENRRRPGGFGGGAGGFPAGRGDMGGEMANNMNCYISITGGVTKISAGGDGIDSNGSLYVSGGEVYANGPAGGPEVAIDYNGTGVITGGTVVAVGNTGMAQGFSETSTQHSIHYSLSSSNGAGTSVALTDGKGKIVITFTPEKQYQSVVISTPAITEGETYQLTAGDQTADITISSMVSGNATGGMGFPGGRAGMQGGTMPEFNGEIPELPEGGIPDFNGEIPVPPEGGMPDFNGERPTMPEGGIPNQEGISNPSEQSL